MMSRVGGNERPLDPRSPVRLAVIDKNPLVRQGLRLLLRKDDRFELVLLAADGDPLFEAMPTTDIDVAVVGWVMTKADGRFVLKRLREMESPIRVVVYTGSADPKVPAEVMTLGGAGFCAKTETPEQLFEVVASVAAGQMVFPFMDVRNLLDPSLPELTRRERSLLAALVTGSTNAQLADQFGLSINTVKFHLGNLYEKLEVRNRAQAVALYLESQTSRETR